MMDLIQNSIEAKASEVELTIRETKKEIAFTVKDNGNGMSKDIQAKAIDPFYSDGKKHAHRRIGLGLPFLIQTAEAANGHAEICSQAGCGTQINFVAEADHVDLPPFGDFAAAATMMISQGSELDLRITHQTEIDSYTLSRSELKETLGDLNDTQNLILMKTYIRSQEDNLRKAG